MAGIINLHQLYVHDSGQIAESKYLRAQSGLLSE
jgi:hypothetical protein